MSGASVRANFIFNLIGPFVRLAVALVTIPIYIRYIGEARYGIISIAWVLLGYFGFLDLGLSRAATNALAKLRDAPQPERARVLLTTMALNLGFGLAGGAVLFVVGGYLLEHIVSVPEWLKPEVARSFPWFAGLFPLSLINGVGIGALESRERFLLANLLQVLGMSMSQIAPVVMAVAVSPALTVVIPAAAIAQALSVVLVLAVVYRSEGPFSLSGVRLDRGAFAAELRRLDFRFECHRSHSRLRRPVRDWLNSGCGEGAALFRADGPGRAKSNFSGGPGADILSAHVQLAAEGGART